MASAKKPRKRAAPKTAGKKPSGAPLEESLLERYGRVGMRMLSDEVPKRLDPSLRSDLESVTGAELDGVRLHTGERAQRMAESLGARAFAAGEQDVFFARGEFAPATSGGKALLAHELTHVAEDKVGLARARRRPEREDLEGSARHAEELVLAREEAAKAPADAGQVEPQKIELPADTKNAKADQKPQTATIDKAALEDKVYELIDKQLRRERERSGRF